MDECPCRYCTFETGRSDTCHGSCERYNTWKTQHDAKVAEERQRRQSQWSSRTGNWYQQPNGYWRNKKLPKGRK